jgi:hypothetical protein
MKTNQKPEDDASSTVLRDAQPLSERVLRKLEPVVLGWGGWSRRNLVLHTT